MRELNERIGLMQLATLSAIQRSEPGRYGRDGWIMPAEFRIGVSVIEANRPIPCDQLIQRYPESCLAIAQFLAKRAGRDLRGWRQSSRVIEDTDVFIGLGAQ